MVQYSCENGWSVYGEGKAFCKLGVWDPPQPPSCVRAGCDPLVTEAGVFAAPQLEGAAFRFECLEDGYTLHGSPVLTCDGQFWNGTVPTCKVVRDTSALLLNRSVQLSNSLVPQTLIAWVLVWHHI